MPSNQEFEEALKRAEAYRQVQKMKHGEERKKQVSETMKKKGNIRDIIKKRHKYLHDL